jgi:hypothetical protein
VLVSDLNWEGVFISELDGVYELEDWVTEYSFIGYEENAFE